MIEIGPEASVKIKELLQAKDREGKALRVAIMGRGPGGYEYSLRFIDAEEAEPDDQAFDVDGIRLLIDADSAPKLEGARLVFIENDYQTGFQLDNPNPVWDDPLSQAVQRVLDEQINPSVASHGGWVMLLDVRGDVAYVQLGGGCQGCGLANVTLKQGIEAMIQQSVPDINQVVDTTDHAAGTNPYYQPSKGGPAESPFN
jgi:Fe/S biogenesis protein NfuA